MAVRKTYNIPLNQIFENLEGFPAERFVEVMAVVQSYCQYWDNYFTDEGFLPPVMTEGALATWNRVKHILQESNKNYFDFMRGQSKKGQAGAAARKEEEKRREEEHLRYVDKREEINAKRRQKYAEEKAKRVQKNFSSGNFPQTNTTAETLQVKSESRFEDNLDKAEEFSSVCVSSYEKQTKNPDENVKIDDFQEVNNFVCTDEKTKNERILLRKKSDESTQSQTDKELAGNSTAVDGLLVIGLNNNTLTDVVIEEGGYGGKQVIHNPPVDSFENNYPSSGLTGNNPLPEAAGGNNPPVGEGNKPPPLKADAAAEGNNSPVGEGNKQQAISSRRKATGIGQAAAPPPRPSPEAGEGDNNSARKGMRGGGAAKNRQPYRWKLGAEVVVEENFDLDFLDPSIADLNFIHDWLINGVVAKIKLWKTGKSIHKKWIRNLIFTFAKNQGYGEELAAELHKRSKGSKNE